MTYFLHSATMLLSLRYFDDAALSALLVYRLRGVALLH